MITLAVIIGAFIWLLYETDWMRVRLLVGTLIITPKRKWQFLKYGDDALILCSGCHIKYGGVCIRRGDRWFGWTIPSKTIQLGNSTLSFNKGCSYIRSKMLRDIVKAQKSKAQPYPASHYPVGLAGGMSWGVDQPYGDIEIKVDGEVKLSLNGESKAGLVRNFMKPYTTKVRIGRKTATLAIGEADRVVKE